MGRAAAAGAGINWLTLSVMAVFHVGALAALFFFTWQRLAVMLVLYVVAINVGIGMCYHRWPFRAGRCSGYRRIAYTTSTAIRKATRTRPARARGGLTPDGSSSAMQCTRRPKC